MLMKKHQRHPAGRDTAHPPTHTVTSTNSVSSYDRMPGTNRLGRCAQMVRLRSPAHLHLSFRAGKPAAGHTLCLRLPLTAVRSWGQESRPHSAGTCSMPHSQTRPFSPPMASIQPGSVGQASQVGLNAKERARATSGGMVACR